MARSAPLAFLFSTLGTLTAAEKVDYNRDIRPILSDKCWNCHGPDDASRKAKLRLDVRDAALGAGAFVPGKPDESELIKRIATKDPEEVMPPPESVRKLTPSDAEKLRQWIAQGGEYSRHWAFIPPQRPEIPGKSHPVDAFINARLAKEGLPTAAPGSKETTLRRVTLDLTGLPPSPAEIDAYLSDEAPGAWERVVDRLLASPHFGERMTLHWLDLARYADTHGYHLDAGREQWGWRDWVIDAFNANQPFDQFVVEQLAGDLLPGATPQQVLATGFVRNNMINFEGGAIPEEYLNAYIVDRVNTVSTVFLGLTMGCAQCHDHKYDPLSMRDFYSFYAFFNSVPENGLDGSRGNAAPMIPVRTRWHEREQKRLAEAVEKARRIEPRSAERWTVAEPTVWESTGGATLRKQPDQSLLATGKNPPADNYSVTLRPAAGVLHGLRVEALTDESMTGGGPGRAPNGNFVLSGVSVTHRGTPVKLSPARADYEQAGYPVSNVTDDNPASGWAVDGNTRHENRTLWLAFAAPVTVQTGDVLEVMLNFGSGISNHSIGRFRLALTDDPRAARGNESPLAAAEKALADFEKSTLTAMVMRQMDKPRDTFVLVRGQYDQHGDKVTAAVPPEVAPMPADAPANRLGLARWLTSPGHPLFARVSVNRFWALFFGHGLVKTQNDFGSQGEWPSHPELLDWLACEFRSGGWNVKSLVRLLVTSDAYRRGAEVTPQQLEHDPENRLLARGPRFRLQGELIRDVSLSTSGLLNVEIGGPPVFPYQPPGLWEELSSRQDSRNWSAQFYEQSHGPALYRRGMYTFWKRTSPPPMLNAFDAPDREVCTVSRERTNTPLQALALLNDPTFVEAARMLAERVMKSAAGTEERINMLFRLCTARLPDSGERDALTALYGRQFARYTAAPAEAARLLATGEYPRDAALPASEHAAWTNVCLTVLNLDETICR